MRFHELELHPDVQKGIDDAGFVECTEVQARTIPHSLTGRDVTVQSQTGTGKTATFLIPIFHHLLKPEFAGGKALILAPTRELAVQIEQEAITLGKHLPFGTACFYGGVGYVKQEEAIRDGAQILIATPGRLLDFVKSGKLGFQDVRFVVIDEADRLFDMGFYPDIQQVFRRLPAKDRMVMLFSATMSTRVLNIAWKYMSDPVEVIVTPEQMTVETVTQELYHVAMNEKLGMLLGILEREKPETSLVFANTKRMCEEISRRLEINGYKSRFIIGDLPQRQRLRLIDELKAGEIEVLVATDVAARGLHVNDLDLVINYDIPEDPENYVHRIGRTARAGKQGKAVSLACERFVFGLEAIEELIGMKIPIVRHSDEDLGEDKSSGQRIVVARDQRTRAGAPHPTRSGRPGHRTPRGEHPAHGGHGAHRSEPRPERGPRRPRGAGRPKPSEPVSDRLAYYRDKYGEDFAPAESTGAGSGARSDGHRPPASDAGNRSPSPEAGNRQSGGPEGASGPKRKRRRSRGRRPAEQGAGSPQQQSGSNAGAKGSHGGSRGDDRGGRQSSSRAAAPSSAAKPAGSKPQGTAKRSGPPSQKPAEKKGVLSGLFGLFRRKQGGS